MLVLSDRFLGGFTSVTWTYVLIPICVRMYTTNKHNACVHTYVFESTVPVDNSSIILNVVCWCKCTEDTEPDDLQ